MDFKNVLVMAPHTDDGELGAGGMINKLIENGTRVTYVAFSTADVPMSEVRRATLTLGVKDIIILNFQVRKLNYYRQEILEEMMNIKHKIDPDLILMPSLTDIHQDHSTIAQEGLRAFKNKSILGYELIWNNLSFTTSCFVELQKRNVQTKVEALKEYKSQEGRDYMCEDFIFSLARVRGVQIGVEYAEVFEVIRWII